MAAIPAVAPMVDVDAVFALAAARSPSHTGSLQPGSHNGSQAESQKLERAA